MNHKHNHSTNGGNQPPAGHAAHSAEHLGEHSGHGKNPKHGEAGHDHSGMIDDFKKRFYVSLFLTVPILVLSDMIQHWSGFQLEFEGRKYLLLALSTALFWYGGKPFLEGCWEELKNRLPGMMTLITMAIIVAFVYSAATVFGFPGMDFFWELATLIVIMLLGHWLEMRSVSGASKALELLVKMIPAEAHMYHGAMLHDMPVEELKPNDRILVRPGEKIPVDGIIVKGESYLNESMLTGESTPVLKKSGEKVIAGAINGNGSLDISVEQTGEGTYLAKVIQMVKEAQNTKSSTQRLADRAAFWLTIVALVMGIGTLTAWVVLGQTWAYAIERMVTVMVISCPHALGLAIPLVVAISTTLAAKNGLLIRNRTAFENARKITTLIFDKTGTLTTGIFGVTRMGSFLPSVSENELLGLAAALEQNSEHPIATGIINEAKKLNLDIPTVDGFEAITGKGVSGKVREKKVLIVSPGYLRENQLLIPNKAIGDASETIVFILIDSQLGGFIALADQLRESSAEAIKIVNDQGIKTFMLTGDNKTVAKTVSEKLGMTGFMAEVLPHQKLDKIKEQQQKGEFVAMTGDGVNDAPALAQADIGIAIGSGTDVAAETADIILVNSDPKDVASLIQFGRATYQKMIQNLVWATAYNVITLPLATGFIPGIVISPAIGAVFMSLSTIIVAINAQMLRIR
ncbi:copper-translocating P-type ATPase [Runella aurantiaca]|uniref:Cadmium-translocating P-type ATPase n=1 Tax=Runella aurantiaca TaxID=2282308 RepID=A0A369I1M3_9BACT|nr:copper-translocating P-type ATPase [Runella aurantiaca]RDB02780.1 cadmium-translocating P-type ATPase [Runella aurantiaca]